MIEKLPPNGLLHSFFFSLILLLSFPITQPVLAYGPAPDQQPGTGIRTVAGQVLSQSSGETMPGVNVMAPGTLIGTVTGIDGRYEIQLPEGVEELQFSFVGYRTVGVAIAGRNRIDVRLEEDIRQLDDLVVVGYGSVARRQLTGSVSRLEDDAFAGSSLTTAEQALQGRVSGVQFTNTSGMLGAPVSMRIRGAASITASTTPLFVIDGIPLTNPVLSGSSAVGAAMGGRGLNPLINIDPNDIVSWEVLKDASATAIYGSRGSNGVVLITTRQGEAGRPRINISSYGGFSTYTNRYDMMNGEEYTRIWNQAAINRFGPEATPYLITSDQISDTDWFDLVTRTGSQQETSVNITGGTGQTRYYIGGTWRWEEGYVRNNEQSRYSTRIRLDHNLSDRVRVGVNLSPSRTDNHRIYVENSVSSPITYSFLMPPNVAARLADGSLNPGDNVNPLGPAFPGTPLTNIEGVTARSNLTRVLGSADLQWMITGNLSLNSEFGIDLFQLQENVHNASITTDGYPDGSAYAGNDQYRNYNFINRLEYRRSWREHDLDFMVGFHWQQSDNQYFSVFGRNFASDDLRNIDSASEITAGAGGETSWAFAGYFSRLNYMFRERFLLTLTGRLDGSSRFGASNRYGFFPAVSAGWIISDEKWYGLPGIDFLKLRAGVGQTGNAEIGNFAALGLVDFGHNYNDRPGGRLSQLANPDLKWEKTTQIDAALEFGLLESRIRGSVGYYLKDTRDLLLHVPISPVNGFTSYLDNFGRVENRGWEFELSADLVRGEFLWNSSFNLATLRNEVKRLVDGQDRIFRNNMLREGEPLGVFYMVRYHGVNPENGNAQWLDRDGNVTETYSSAHRVIAGSPFPDFFGGFTNTFSWKGIDLRVFFQYQVGNKIYRDDGSFTDTNLNSMFNQTRRQNDYWTEENPDAANPKPYLFITNGAEASTRYLEDGSYLRLKQLMVGYTLPVSVTGANSRLRIFAQGQNLITWTNYQGLDPEAASGGNIQAADIFFQMPQPKVVTFGINLTL